jgi:hypothetical protein
MILSQTLADLPSTAATPYITGTSEGTSPTRTRAIALGWFNVTGKRAMQAMRLIGLRWALGNCRRTHGSIGTPYMLKLRSPPSNVVPTSNCRYAGFASALAPFHTLPSSFACHTSSRNRLRVRTRPRPVLRTEEGIQLKLVGVAAEPLYRYLMQPPTHHCPVPPSHVIISASSLPKTSMRAACGIQYLHVTNRRPPLRVRKVANKKKVKRGRGRGPRIVQGPPPPPAGLTTKP